LRCCFHRLVAIIDISKYPAIVSRPWIWVAVIVLWKYGLRFVDVFPSQIKLQLKFGMYKGHPFASKVLERIEKEKCLQNHRNNLRNVRPSTGMAEPTDNYLTLNSKKKEMQNENKFTEIERENRLLLNKITHIMDKKRSSSEMKGSGSLNSTLRRRQFQSIEVENAKMLKRLQERKSDYELHKFKKEWRKTKAVIKNITSYPIIIDEITGRKKRKNIYCDLQELRRVALTDPEEFHLVKVKLIDSRKFIVTLKFTPTKFVVIGDMRTEKELKVIELDKGEALQFIE
jgi:hypothetical protein